MRIFTFIAEYMGGTYLKQVLSDSLETALADWINGIEEDDFGGGLQRGQIERARTRLLDEKPGPVTGLTSVWCTTTRIGKNLVIVHIVANEGSPPGGPSGLG